MNNTDLKIRLSIAARTGIYGASVKAEAVITDLDISAEEYERRLQSLKDLSLVEIYLGNAASLTYTGWQVVRER
jgi:hypothetical protein